MIITKELLKSGASDRGGWNKKQVQCLGYQGWTKGWLKECVGKEISKENATLFLDLKNDHRKRKQEIKNDEAFIRVKNALPREEQYQHPNWQRKRLQVMERDEFKCMLCGEKDKMLHVHHNTYEGKNIWECRMSYMITLCLDCHEKAHGRTFK